MIMKLNKILTIFIITLLFSIINSPAYSSLFYERLPELSSDASSGYSPSNFKLENISSKSIEVKIQVEHIEYSGVRERNRNTTLITEKKLKLGANESRNESIYCITNYSNRSKSFSANIFEDGKSLKGEYLSKAKIGRGGYQYHISVLADKLIPEKSIKKLFYNDTYAAHYVDDAMEELPINWVDYTQYRHIFYTAKTFNSLSDEVKSAILDYVKAGGNLFIFGAAEEFSSINFCFYTSFKVNWIKRSYQLGFGNILICDEDFFERLVAPKKEDINYHTYSYSKKNDKKEEEKEEPLPANHIRSEDALFDGFQCLDEDAKFLQSENKIPEVISQYKKDYKEQSNIKLIIFVIVSLFLICPVNLIVLKILKKQQLLLLTSSITGLICGIILFGYYSLTTARIFEIYRQSVTLLDEKEKSALTFGGQAFLSGRTINEPIELPLKSVVIPYLEHDVYYGEKNYNFRADRDVTRVIEFSDAQRLTKNWIRANKPMAFSVTSQKQTDACLEIKEVNGNIEIKNNLGAAIDSLYIMPQIFNKLYCLKDIKPGDTARIDLSTDNSSRPVLSLRVKNLASFNYIKENPSSVIHNGQYLAFLKSDPFMAQRFDAEANIHELGCAVIGTYKGNFNL